MSASLNPVSSTAPTRESLPVERSQLGPFERMGALGRKSGRAWWLSWLAAVVLHASSAGSATLATFEVEAFARLVRLRTEQRLAASIDIEEEQLPEPEPEKPPEPEEQVEPPEAPEPTPLVPKEPEPIDTEPEAEPPPAAAEAAKVLTTEPEPDAPLDLTNEGFISGTGTRFAGGVTASAGTATKAVRDPGARAGGVSGGRGTSPAPASVAAEPAVDKSRPAGLPQVNWNNCGFPPEADVENINQAQVQAVISVDKNGKPTAVTILSDPDGFGYWFRKCAMRYTFPVGLDKWGNPIASSTKPFRIRFTR